MGNAEIENSRLGCLGAIYTFSFLGGSGRRRNYEGRKGFDPSGNPMSRKERGSDSLVLLLHSSKILVYLWLLPGRVAPVITASQILNFLEFP